MATSTENYNFKKPDESDFYDIADENKNWDLADEALKNLDTPTFEDYTGSTAVPAATDAINQMKSKRKLGVLLSNIKAAFKGACLIGHIVNNCVTDNAGLPLSAAQGKVLKDLYTQLYSDSQALANNLSGKRVVDQFTAPTNTKITYAYKYGNMVSLTVVMSGIKDGWNTINLTTKYELACPAIASISKTTISDKSILASCGFDGTSITVLSSSDFSGDLSANFILLVKQ